MIDTQRERACVALCDPYPYTYIHPLFRTGKNKKIQTEKKKGTGHLDFYIHTYIHVHTNGERKKNSDIKNLISPKNLNKLSSP